MKQCSLFSDGEKMTAIVGLHFLAAGYMQLRSVAFTSSPRKVVHGRFGTINLHLILYAEVASLKRMCPLESGTVGGRSRKILLSSIKARPQSTMLQHQCDIMAEHHIWAVRSQASLSASAPSSSFQRWFIFS